MSKNLLIISGFLGLFLMFAGCTHEERNAVKVTDQKFTCPMHPQIVSDEPGTCPICGMDLVPVNAQTGKNELMLSEAQAQLANIKTIKVGAGSFTGSRLLNARLLTSPEQTRVISSRYSGRIEKLYVKETGRALQKGEPLFQIYSEDLQALQQDYVLQLKQAAAFPEERIYRDLLKAAKDKLLLYGYTGAEVQALAKAARISPVITVYSRESGIVNEINVAEGSYIAQGAPVVRLEDLSRLWVEADAYPAEAARIRIGTSVKVQIEGVHEAYSMQVDFIAPEIAPGSQIVKVRGSINNRDGHLQPGMQATVLLPAGTVSDAMQLPLDAIIRKEDGAHVWIKTAANTFEPRKITTGPEDSDRILVTSGLRPGDEVVISGGYLLYSEFILKKGADPTAASIHQ